MDEKVYQFPLKQHIGEKSVPCVAEEDTVYRGTLIAERKKESLGANIYSSVSGRVIRVTEDFIEVQADTVQVQPDTYVKLKSEKPLDLIRESGLVGLGGAGFPTYAKFSKPFEDEGTV